ncbi:MBL fold metallo-hydrolase [Thalassovita sp.]|uniref:MBL fold metallo-hydrolase n=1 Tax=Thalassovita sp. TaxID=1979401 RepID=UPI00288129E2|nr:MBL fold metallo-hydrolase [Thalassovita sp.]MDF1803734.1 MBL fold metallo-hydrolase [Thalassovita sp.]
MTRFTMILTLMMSLLARPLLADMLVTQIATDTYALVGPLGNRDPENLGNNSTHGLVVTPEGAILIDAGGSYKGAQALDTMIQGITDQPVKFVINTGGQDHRWIGNSYWKDKGAVIIASNDAVADQASRASMQQTVLATLIGPENLSGTTPIHADITFDEWYDLSLGGTTLQISHLSGAHTPGDSFVWHPAAGTVFTGDIVYIQRILGVLEFSSSANWLESFDAMAALNPTHIVPGHGAVTDLATATRDTRDYLANLRGQMRDYIDEGGDIIGSVEVNQSDFAYLANFDILARRNAQQVFSEMEWE